MPETARPQPVRRVVTGHNPDGQSVVASDTPSPHVLATSGGKGPVVTDLWKSLASPADNTAGDDPCGDITLAPPPGGTVFRTVEFPPDSAYMAGWDEHAAFAAMGHPLDHGQSRKGATVGMHRTASLDYAIVLSGSIWAVMDQGETLLHPGDVLVQRGTNHGWSNRGTQPAVLAFVLVGAHPWPHPAPTESV
jgi:mannose-6-phosphate isomerase-like protein (cupin superfamily)